MARVNLVLCDLCGNKIDEDSVDLYTVNLFSKKEGISLEDKVETGEVCEKCFAALVYRLKSDKKSPIQEAPTESTPLTMPEAVTKPQSGGTTQSPDDTYDVLSAPVAAPQPKGGRESTKELLDDELQAIPSRFDKRTAARAARKLRGSSCPHSFKSYQDGSVVCTGPPDGFSGDLESLDNPNGCGKKLTKGEY